MFSIGGMELVVILVVALIVLGPKGLPKMARTLGRTMGEFRRATTELQRTINLEAIEEEEREQAKKAAATPQSSGTPAEPEKGNKA